MDWKDLAKAAINKMAYLEGVSFLNGEYAPQSKIQGVDSNLQSVTYGEPVLEFDTLSLEGTPIHMYFKLEKDIVRMYCQFLVKTDVEDSEPMDLTELNIKMKIEGKKPINLGALVLPGVRPQVVQSTHSWNNIHDFLAVREAIENGQVEIEWNGKIQWVDISSPQMQANLKREDYRPQPIFSSVQGTIPITVVRDSASHNAMFDGVKGLLCWESVVLNAADDKKVYFRDPFKDDALYFLPQEYRIKAKSNNAPDMTTEVVVGQDGTKKILKRFRIAPYVHPQAKRDVYNIFLQRKGKKYCELRYGGYNSARFEWGGEMKDGNLYGEKGINTIVRQEEIQAAPESSFIIVLEMPNDHTIELFEKKIMDEGLYIGDVYFTVYEGMYAATEREIGPIQVHLDLHKLVGIRPDVTVDKCSWPDYEATVANRGKYPIEIGGLAVSVLQRKDNQVKDAEHKLNFITSSALPVTLEHNAFVKLRLSEEQAEQLKHRKLLGIGKVKEDYWNELICEPFSIRLHDEDIKEIMSESNESTNYELREWSLAVMIFFHWSDHPDLAALQVRVKNKFGVDEIVTLTNGEEKASIPMTPNLAAILQTQQDNDNRQYKYRFRLLTKDGPKEPDWTAWFTGSNDSLILYEEDLSEPTVSGEDDESIEEGSQTGTGGSEPEWKDLTLSFRMDWDKSMDKAYVDVIYDDDKNEIHFKQRGILLERAESENPKVTFKIKNPEIKPRIIVWYINFVNVEKNRQKKLVSSDLITVDNPMVILPKDAPSTEYHCYEFEKVCKDLDSFAPNYAAEALKSKEKKKSKLWQPIFGAVVLLGFLMLVFFGRSCSKQEQKLNFTADWSKLYDDRFSYDYQIRVDVRYDDDKNNIHYSKSDTIDRKSDTIPDSFLTFTIPVKNPKIKPQFQAYYYSIPGMSSRLNDKSIGCRRSDWITATDATVVLPDGAPSVEQVELSEEEREQICQQLNIKKRIRTLNFKVNWADWSDKYDSYGFFLYQVCIDVKYDDDENNIHSLPRVNIERIGDTIPDLPHTCNITIVNPEIKPQMQVLYFYTNKMDASRFFSPASIGCKRSRWISMKDLTVVLPDDAPPVDQVTISESLKQSHSEKLKDQYSKIIAKVRHIQAATKQ